MSYSRCFSADLDKGTLTALEAKLLSPAARKKVEGAAVAALQKIYGENEMEWTPGTVTISDATSLCVDGADLVVKFQPYEAGPYALGAPRVTIPRTDV
ncbi:MAG: RsiV family protein, partial [Xanthobacteraceae bacterium]